MMVPMTLEHLNFIVHEMDDAQWNGIQCLYEDKDKAMYAATMYKATGIKISVVEGGEVWACGGIVYTGNSTGVIWMAHRPGWLKHIKQVYEACKRVIKLSGLRNVKAFVLENSERNNNFIKHLGFKLIGVDEQLGDGGENFNIYGYTRGKA